MHVDHDTMLIGCGFPFVIVITLMLIGCGFPFVIVITLKNRKLFKSCNSFKRMPFSTAQPQPSAVAPPAVPN